MRPLILFLNGLVCLACLVLTVMFVQGGGWAPLGAIGTGPACLLSGLMCFLTVRRTPPGNVARAFILLVSLSMIGAGIYFAEAFRAWEPYGLSLLGFLNLIYLIDAYRNIQAVSPTAAPTKAAMAICVVNALLFAVHCYFLITFFSYVVKSQEEIELILALWWRIMRGQALPALAALVCGYAAWTGRLQRLALVFSGIVLILALYAIAYSVYADTFARLDHFTLARIVFLYPAARAINLVYFFQLYQKAHGRQAGNAIQ
ncbi:MAG: hypothetical protein LBV01_02440 [Deltaproteobacteria bacterium]|jgi:hypothetical protein|nr:hypothetical protein [Deltaproteobacteria bacterium]